MSSKIFPTFEDFFEALQLRRMTVISDTAPLTDESHLSNLSDDDETLGIAGTDGYQGTTKITFLESTILEVHYDNTL